MTSMECNRLTTPITLPYFSGNIDVQAESIAMLASDDLDFQWLLPGVLR